MRSRPVYPRYSKYHFHGNRLASISDLELNEWKSAYNDLEGYSNRYVDFIIEHKLLFKDYPWPVDPVHNFTRIWEYPYAYHQLSKYAPLHLAAKAPKVFDVGSALTFLPSFFASLGYEVKASDSDPAMKRNFESMKSHPDLPKGVKDVSYATCDCKNITTEPDAYYDAIVCISVLEHIEERDQAIREFSRILKPGGVLILTVDIKLCPSSLAALDSDEISSLTEDLRRYFDFLEPDSQVHPLDILKETNRPRHLTEKSRCIKKPSFCPARKIKKMIKRKKEAQDTLTVYGMTLMRRGKS
ncbi:class I SAM-dependent methyltransferase [Candidatus Omnitrophota bacterium]